MARLPTLRASVPTLKRQAVPELTTSATLRTRGSSWMATRARILTRAHGLCECAACAVLHRIQLARPVDHIIPLWAGGADVDGNLQAMATTCHARKTKAEERMRARGIRPAGPLDWLEWADPER